jgi:collagenase-like PrtC family protease
MQAVYHLPGLFEFHEFYKKFLPIYCRHRDWFYDWCAIGSVYGAPAGCRWDGGRAGFGEEDPAEVAALMRDYGISARLTFSNSLLREEHLSDRKCNALCRMAAEGANGVIVASDLLTAYLQETYPELYLVSSTTKVQTKWEDFEAELNRSEYQYVVPDFRLNIQTDKMLWLTQSQKDKVELLCNECCSFGCPDRKKCYEDVSRKSLGEEGPDHRCTSPLAERGYRFSDAMENPGFIGIEDIQKIWLPGGFSNFKLEGRSLGSAIVLEFLLYYMTRPECRLKVREEVYLDSMLDLF